ncbi:MAG: hypothetical protein KKH08_01640 [Candidatus Omnitrophica bacterium]|nr:hypothetical protein [Candidatus Omnitrophota bacterium]
MRKPFIFCYVFLAAILCVGVTLMAEEITLTTYYPAPYGAYDELTATKLDVGGTGIVVGATYSGVETAPVSGMLVEGNVAIGKATDTAELDVNGTIDAVDYSVGGTAGASGTFISNDAVPKTITVEKGIITSII